MRSLSMYAAIPVFVLALAATAAAVDVARIPVSSHEPGIELVEQRDDGLTFRVTVGELAAFDVETEEGTFSRLMLPGFHASREVGKPELPMINRLFEIPYGAEVSVEVTGYETREVVLADFGVVHPLMPAQPSVFKNQDPETLPFHFDPAAYERDEAFGFDLARAVDTGRMRAVRIGRLEIAPVRYNPASGTLTVSDNIEVSVRFVGADRAADAALKAATRSPFFEVVYRMLAGSRGLHDSHPDLLDGPVTYVIVSDPLFETQLQPFVAWKAEQGFNVIEAYTDDPQVGSTTTSIQNYLHDLYNNGTPENPAPTFVLFVGDVAEIPAFNLSGYSDLPYCDVGGDDIPEMYYGRFSASNTTDLQPQIDKTLEYEQYLMPDPAFLGEAVMIAGVDATYASTYGNGAINYGTNLYFNTAHGILSHTYLYPESGSSGPQIIQNVSDGCCYVNYTAHGSQTSWSNPSFTMTNVSGLSNNHEYCLAVGNCCLTSSFQVTTCFAEHWLRVADKGAIGYIGGSESTLWDEDYFWAVGNGPVIASGPSYSQTGLGAYDGIFHDHGEGIGQWYVCQDAQIFCGNLAVQESGSYYTSYYWEIYNLMGDPSLMVYFGVPDANPVVLLETIEPSATEISVSAAPKSYVGLTKDGAPVGSGLVGESGTAVIPISGQGADGSVHVVVTCQNRIPYSEDVPIATLEGPHLVLDHNDIVDVGGDNDGSLDAGESIDLISYVKNVGNQAATAVTGVLAETRGLTITDDSETWGTVSAGQTKPCDDSFNLTVTSDTPDQTAYDFTLTLTSAESSWVRTFTLTVEAPVVDILSCTIGDGAGGDGDGVAEPGETMDLTFRLENTGHEDARNVNGTLSSTSALVTIHQNSGSVSSVPEGGTADLAGFNVTISPTCPEMTTISFTLDLAADLGYAASFSYGLPISPFFDDFETDLGWTISGDASTGMWERADPEGTSYNGEDLQPENDHTPAPGVRCMVTGPLAGSSAGSYDVDGGTTTVTSPLFDLTDALSATLEYWRWYSNNLGSAPGEDWWTVQASANAGTTWVNLERTQASNNSWQKMTFDLGSHIPLTGQVQVRFIAADEGTGSLVEAAVDDFLLSGVKEDLTPVVDEEGLRLAGGAELMQNRPNPFNPQTEIAYRLGSPEAVRTALKIYDATGRLVRILVDAEQPAGEYRAAWDGTDERGHRVASGVFFYVLTSGEERQTRKMVVLK